MILNIGSDVELYLSRKNGIILATTKEEQSLSNVQIRNGRFSGVIKNPSFQTREIWVSGCEKDLKNKDEVLEGNK